MHLLSWLDSTLVKKQPPWCSMKKDVLRNFAKLTGKHLCQSLFFNKVAATLLKKRLLHRCFPANFAKFRRTRFLQNTSGRLFYQLNYHMVKNSSLPSRIHFFFFLFSDLYSYHSDFMRIIISVTIILRFHRASISNKILFETINSYITRP